MTFFSLLQGIDTYPNYLKRNLENQESLQVPKKKVLLYSAQKKFYWVDILKLTATIF